MYGSPSYLEFIASLLIAPLPVSGPAEDLASGVPEGLPQLWAPKGYGEL